jgi:phytanoyl-CoA hydroxylase
MKETFLSQGFSHIPNFVPNGELAWLREQYDLLLADTKMTKGLRSDLSGKGKQARTEKSRKLCAPASLFPN